MSDYGDTDIGDPEDAYDVSDTPGERLRNFVRRIDWLDEHPNMTIEVARGRIQRMRDDLVTLINELAD